MPSLFLALVLLVSALAPVAGQTLSAKERAIADRIPRQQAAAVALLERVVNINSGTLNLAGVRAVGRVFQQELEKVGFTARWVMLPDSLHRAGHLIAERKGRPGSGKRLLLLGHLDTVFEPSSPFQRFEWKDSIVRGPGVNDMKGGNVMIVSALQALAAEGALDDATVTVALMGDEENPADAVSVTRAALVDAAKRTDVVLGFESSTFTQAVVARRGFSSWRLLTHGEQAHSQGIFADGNGAVFELARDSRWLLPGSTGRALSHVQSGPGSGGHSGRVRFAGAPRLRRRQAQHHRPEAVAAGDLRFISEAQKRRARDRMRAIVARHLPGTSAEIAFYDDTPAMEPKPANYVLLRELDQVSRALGGGPVAAQDPGSRGAGDISFVAGETAALDGLGTFGGGDHSPSEYMNLNAMPMLTQRVALLIYRLTRQPGA